MPQKKTPPPPAPPEGPKPGFPIVGIGASAGGLAAFEAFFSGLPAEGEPGMAFVLVQHLAPDHKSLLVELIRRSTRLQVQEVEDGIPVRVNCAYVIPPGRDMALFDGCLHLLEPAEPRGRRLPIDFFFRSLARDQHEHAIGIVLSGTGADGTQGVRAIKAEGGLVLAQSTASVEFEGMPRSAVATGLVDFELPPAEMPARLLSYVRRLKGDREALTGEPVAAADSALKKIFLLLRSQTGHDFSLYKPSTIQRRIARRMAVNQIDAPLDYVRYLQRTATEVDALFRDLLIGVTSFFRDPEAYQVLETVVIPELLAHKPAGSAIRVWTAGCSTGEEAYSIAMLLQERLQLLKTGCTVQVFATDIDTRAIAVARAGLYPAGIAADITPERLARHFTAEPDGSGYRVQKSLRDLLIFSEQDVIKDPPFSRLDIISCRNLMIYMGAELQKKMIPLFHYALRQGGSLFLGSSEGVGEFDTHFKVIDRKAKLYKRREDMVWPRPPLLGRYLPPLAAAEGAAQAQPQATAQGAVPRTGREGRSFRETTEQALLAEVVAAGVLVSSTGDIVYLHGRTGLFFEPSPGDAGVNNVLRMAREGLRRELASSLHKAVATRDTVHCMGVNVKTNGHYTRVNLTVRPVINGPGATPDAPLFLVVLAETGPENLAAERTAAAPLAAGAEGDGAAPANDHQALVAALRAELRAKDEYLQSTFEELASSSEELKSSNEEMQSINEELQSTNEELETSKEELQSLNEELATVNLELQTKLNDLSRANDDMNNLLAGTGIGTVFVDHQLRILRFTPAASAIINLIASDVGRPVTDIVSNLAGYGSLEADVKAVLGSLVPREVDVATRDGKSYAMRIQPYRTLQNVIEGAVISFVDITEIVKTRNELRQVQELTRLAVVLRDAQDAITVHDLAGRTLAWNPAAQRLFGWTEAEALAMNVRDRISPTLGEHEMQRLQALSAAGSLQPLQTQRLTKSGQAVAVTLVASPLLDANGRVYATATTERFTEKDQP